MMSNKNSNYLFSPEGPFWRVNREWLVGLAGMRAVLLQMAHPLIAAGVWQHSNFRGDPLGRLYRTMKSLTLIGFGTTDQMYAGVRHINRCHASITGTLNETTGPFLRGTPYDANDPELKLWVMATVIDSAMRAYEYLIAPLSVEEKQAYYRESQTGAHLLGIPPTRMPATHAGFIRYMESMLASKVLTVGKPAREIADALFAPTLVGRFARASSFISIGLLPARIRADYGLPWDRNKEIRLQHLAWITRHVRPRLPDVLAINPEAWKAERQWQHDRAQANKQQESPT